MATEPARKERWFAPFSGPKRAREADQLGMLLFLASEIMLFGGLFAAALAMRIAHSADFARASARLHLWLGGINTAVLLTSSLCVALAVEAVRDKRARLAGWLLSGAVALGLGFLAIKAVEYWEEYHEGLMPMANGTGLDAPVHRLFMDLYFTTTGLHAVHVTIGILLLASLIWPLGRARRDTGAVLMGNVGLYWHLVDVIWLFLYPALYLARP